ncbi:MAG: hypothetical protein V2A54_16775 [Bacteroidota bacterium]
MLKFIRRNKIKLGALLLIVMLSGTSCRARKRNVNCYRFMFVISNISKEITNSDRQ